LRPLPVTDLFTMNDVVALSHMKLAALSSGQSRVDAALLHKSILIVNALEAHHAAHYSQERRLAPAPPALPAASAVVPHPATPKLAPIPEEEDDLIDLDHILLEPAVTSPEPAFTFPALASEISHVEVVEVGDSDDDDFDGLSDDGEDDDASMSSSAHSIVSFATAAASPAFALSYPSSSPAASTGPVYDDFSDSDGDEDEVITPPQPVLLDDFKGDCDFGAYDADELEAVAGLSLFGAASSARV